MRRLDAAAESSDREASAVEAAGSQRASVADGCEYAGAQSHHAATAAATRPKSMLAPEEEPSVARAMATPAALVDCDRISVMQTVLKI